MSEHLQILAEVAFLFGVIFVLTVAGIYVSKRFRGQADHDASLTSDMTTTFRELHGRGHLSDDEYRTIEIVLKNEIRRDSRDSGLSD